MGAVRVEKQLTCTMFSQCFCLQARSPNKEPYKELLTTQALELRLEFWSHLERKLQ